MVVLSLSVKRAFVIAILTVCILSNSVGQIVVVGEDDNFTRKYINPDYKEYSSIGETVDGRKEGLWRDISVDSIIYREGHYHNNVPVDLWTVFYPNGSKRKQTLYDSLGNVISWSRYFRSTKIVEIGCSDRMTPNLYASLISYEDEIFLKEISEYVSINLHKPTGSDYRFAHYFEETNVIQLLENALIIISELKENTEVTYWFENGLKRKWCKFEDGIEEQKTTFNYNNDKIRKMSYYSNGELVKTEYYDKEGYLKKTK